MRNRFEEISPEVPFLNEEDTFFNSVWEQKYKPTLTTIIKDSALSESGKERFLALINSRISPDAPGELRADWWDWFRSQVVDTGQKVVEGGIDDYEKVKDVQQFLLSESDKLFDDTRPEKMRGEE